jgi:dCMP deaminase
VERVSWPEHALNIARAASARSEDPWLRVGACVLRSDMSIASVGYNGAPPGVNLDWTDRDARRKYVLHAEVNALRYVTYNEVANGMVAVTHLTCAECLKHIVAHGVRQVYYELELDPAVYDASEILRVADMLGVNMTKVEGNAS